ncbi:hypothetical protein HDA40_001770 [Hamadaea flava]|uniref:Uncharacterized protein n=2 Tax=Actinomycetes TaxID=1760 RepID=A0ABV8LP54_9ACTN|nr:hypothetical protein [Hamadaea flava]MCP2323263.1 hypothetical protein [Hamadaea flava]
MADWTALALGGAGLAITAAPAINRARRRYRLRAMLKQDLELVAVAEQVKLQGPGVGLLRESIGSRFVELVEHERLVLQRAGIRRTWVRRGLRWALALGGATLVSLAVGRALTGVTSLANTGIGVGAIAVLSGLVTAFLSWRSSRAEMDLWHEASQ